MMAAAAGNPQQMMQTAAAQVPQVRLHSFRRSRELVGTDLQEHYPRCGRVLAAKHVPRGCESDLWNSYRGSVNLMNLLSSEEV